VSDAAEAWHSRWSDGRIGFHEGRPNTFLQRHVARLGTAQRVFVPLCGKAEDLAFLAAQGHHVIGVELVEDAVRAFFAEHQLTPTVTTRGPFTAYQSGAVTLLAGDFFATTPALLEGVTALYDRAAIIALPEALRRRYSAHLRTVMPAGSPGLVITVEYPQAEMSGPPFSVPELELRSHYAGLGIERLDVSQAEGGRLAAMGERARECCFSVRF
jgi:thiopurine S-methyltransferase